VNIEQPKDSNSLSNVAQKLNNKISTGAPADGVQKPVSGVLLA